MTIQKGFLGPKGLGFSEGNGDGDGATADYENIFFEAISPDSAKITRGFAFKVTAKTDYSGISTIVTSSDAAYTLNDTVSAGDYLKVSSDTLNSITVLTIEPV